MKKVLASLLSMFLAVAVFAGNMMCVNAEAVTPKLELTGGNSVVGEQTSYLLTATDFDSVKGMDLTITVPNNMAINSVSASGINLVANNSYTLIGNTLHIVDTFATANPAVSSFTVTINVTATTSGNYKPTVSGKFVGANKEFVNITPTVETIRIVQAITGDINGDANIDILDLISFKKHFLMATVEIIAKNSDINIDGSINTNDLIALKRLLLQII